jgi:hypothetical protein
LNLKFELNVKGALAYMVGFKTNVSSKVKKYALFLEKHFELVKYKLTMPSLYVKYNISTKKRIVRNWF